MPDQLKIAIIRQIPSPESEFIGSVLLDADVYDPWMPVTSPYDVAVCIGPVKHCPPAKKRILFVLGQTQYHADLDWDMIVVTSPLARRLAIKKFSHRAKVHKLIPPVLQLHTGRRRLVEENRDFLHASDIYFGSDKIKTMMNLWGTSKMQTLDLGDVGKTKMFTALEFNSLVRGGGVGLYPDWMQDGYDVQVRRHLALGGRVICRKDKELLGDANDLVDDIATKPELLDLNPTKPVIWKETEETYAAGIQEVIRRA